MNGNGPNGSSSRSTLAAGNLGGAGVFAFRPGGAGGGEKPPRHPGRMKSTHELDGAAVIPATPGASTGSKRPAVIPRVAGGDEGERFKCKTCKRLFIADEDLQCHIRRCHVYRSWRCGKEEAPPSVAARKPLSSSSRTNKKGCSVVSKQREQEQHQQQTGEAAAAETPARTVVVDFAFDLNVLAPEVEEEKTSSG